MDDQQYFMIDYCFTPKLKFGCISITNADQLPIDGANVIYGDGTLTLALDSIGAVASFVSINLFRFPEGLAEFKEQCEWYGRDRKSRAKLPEGVPFDESMLSIEAIPKDWHHEAYPQSNRKFVHLYQGTKQAVLIRWIAKSGTILDNPLFKLLVTNLQITPGQWITDPPTVELRTGSPPETKESELSDEVRRELDEAAARARKSLQLGRVRRPEKVAEAIHDAITELRVRKGIKTGEKKQLAIDYGALWGRVLCDAAGWTWCCVDLSSSAEPNYAVCSPNRSHAVAPLQAMFEAISRPKADNNSLLLFNMIVSGDLPVSPANGFCWLS